MLRLPRLTYLYPSALAHAFYLFTFGLFSPQARLRLANLGYEAGWFQSPLPVVSLAEVLGHADQLTLLEVDQLPGNTTLTEQIVLARLTEQRQPTQLFEFGTFDGRSSLNLISHAPSQAHLHTLDLPASEMDKTKLALESGERSFVNKAESGRRFQGTSYASRITSLYGDSATFDFSPHWGTMDLVFVDASHAYAYVRSDSENALKLLRPAGGLIAWHDYSRDWPGVIRALNEFYRTDSRFGGLQKVEGTTLVILRVGTAKS